MIEFKTKEEFADVFTERYECEDYACMAHPDGCFFCKYLTDVFWDYTHGPYMFFCEHPADNGDHTDKGIVGQCELFERE